MQVHEDDVGLEGRGALERGGTVRGFADPGTVRLRVVDDGAGVPPPRDGAAASGFGLLGVRERAERVGGRVVVESRPGAGTTLGVEVPG